VPLLLPPEHVVEAPLDKAIRLAEEAAQAFLQHWQKEHPENLENERAPPLQVQEHLLVRSDKGKTGFRGVFPRRGRYQAECTLSTCLRHHLGTFGTAEEAAQAFLQHWQKEHPEELENERAPPLQVQEHLLMRSVKGKTGFRGVRRHRGRYPARCTLAACHNHSHGTFGTAEEAAQAFLQHWQKEHPEELENERAAPSVLLPVAARAAAAGPLIGTIGTRLVVRREPTSGGLIVFSLSECKFTPEGHLEQFKLFRIELNFNKPDLRYLLEATSNPRWFGLTLKDGNFQPEMVWPHPER
jgi:hypothetical protein